jgi:hypothetical protein
MNEHEEAVDVVGSTELAEAIIAASLCSPAIGDQVIYFPFLIELQLFANIIESMVLLECQADLT